MSNFNLNKVILGGRLTGDPELSPNSAGHRRYLFRSGGEPALRRKGSGAPHRFHQLCRVEVNCGICVEVFSQGQSHLRCGKHSVEKLGRSAGQQALAVDVVVDEANFVDSAGGQTRGGCHYPG